jgi:hypothetical protein
MMIYYLIIILNLVEKNKVLSINNELNTFEKNLLYTHIKTVNDLEIFYKKILQSNNIDDLKLLRNIINSNDIQNLNFENKVNISIEVSIIFFFFFFSVLNP